MALCSCHQANGVALYSSLTATHPLVPGLATLLVVLPRYFLKVYCFILYRYAACFAIQLFVVVDKKSQDLYTWWPMRGNAPPLSLSKYGYRPFAVSSREGSKHYFELKVILNVGGPVQCCYQVWPSAVTRCCYQVWHSAVTRYGTVLLLGMVIAKLRFV